MSKSAKKVLKKYTRENLMKKRVYLAIFALTFGLCAGCGNKEADSDISGMEDTVFQTEEPLELSGNRYSGDRFYARLL